MRAIPAVRLTKASDHGQRAGRRSSWVVIVPKEDNKPIGWVVRDLDPLLPPTLRPWQSFMRLDNDVHQHFGWHRTRGGAEDAVRVEYGKRQAEAEAHELNDSGDYAFYGVPAYCQSCHLHISLHPESMSRRDEGDDSSCGEYQYVLRLVPRMPEDFPGGWSAWKRAFHDWQDRQFALFVPDEVPEPVHTEVSRRLKEAAGDPHEKLDWDTLIKTTSDIIENHGGLRAPLISQPNFLKVGDSPLVVELHEHLTSPWRLTPSVMETLLERVRNLERLVAESGRE